MTATKPRSGTNPGHRQKVEKVTAKASAASNQVSKPKGIERRERTPSFSQPPKLQQIHGSMEPVGMHVMFRISMFTCFFDSDRSFPHSMEEKIWQFVFDGHFRNVTD